MNKIFKYILLTVMVFNTTAFAKENKSGLESLKTTFKMYKQFTLEGQFEKTIDYIYPPVFAITPKETLINASKMVKESGGMPKITSIKETIKTPFKSYSKGSYTLIKYTMDMTMNLTPPVKKENKEEYAKVQKMLNSPSELKAYKSFMLQMLKARMGKDAVITSSKKSSLTFNIKKISTLIAINENKIGWKFVEPEPQMIAELKKVLPKEIIKNEKKIFDVKVPTAEEQMAEMMKIMQENRKK